MQAERAEIAVIGAGASGSMAAIAAAAEGADVLLLEQGEKIAGKLYATGNGRCNLTNLVFSDSFYHTGERESLSPYFSRFSPEDLCAFFEERGVYLHDRNGYVYPRTDQASTIVQALEKEMRRLGVRIITSFRASEISRSQDGDLFVIRSADAGRQIFANAVILSAGGLAGPQYGCHGDGYRFAQGFGHSVRAPLPALTSLHSSARFLKTAAGARVDAEITLLADGKTEAFSRGEVQLTADSVSGIPAFQVSGAASRSLEEGKSISVQLDFLPEFTATKWADEKRRRLSQDRQQSLGMFFLGLVNNKVLSMVLQREDLQAENKAYKLSDDKLMHVLESLRSFVIPIDRTGDFAKAQTTSGGVPLKELDGNLQSRLCRGLYLTGEIADVDGLCGGYNLQWAMTSGYLAGKHAGTAAAERRGQT